MSSTKFIHDEIDRFLATSEPEVLCITGAWGVGKTFTWKKFLEGARSKNAVALKLYAYVSLFGINSLQELKASLFQETLDVESLGKPVATTVMNSIKSPPLLSRLATKIGSILPVIRDYVIDATPFLFYGVRAQIICLDDLERAGKDLSAKDVLGLISFLKEERRCKIVLLLNQSELGSGDKEDFETQLEKVIDSRLVFEPTPEEAVAIAITGKLWHEKELAQDCIKLGLTNIRIIRKIERVVQRLRELLKTYDSAVVKQAVNSATLFGWMIHQPKGAPPLSLVKDYNSWSHIFAKEEEVSDEEKSWRALLKSYGFTHMDEFDQIILEGVQRGSFDPEALKGAADTIAAQIEYQKQDSSFSDAWRLYHDSFTASADEVLDKMAPAFRSAVKTISPTNLAGTVKLFKDLGKPNEAKELLAFYMDQRANEPRKFFDLANSPFGSEVREPDVTAAFAEKLAQLETKKDPKEVLQRIAKQDGWNPEDITTLARLSVTDLVDLFKQGSGPQLSALISATLQFSNIEGATDEMKIIGKNAKEALRYIANESPINARRVGRYGIAPDPQKPKNND
jgi:hypothetical protein